MMMIIIMDRLNCTDFAECVFWAQLTDDSRWHEMFAGMVREACKGEAMPAFQTAKLLLRNVDDYRPSDVPVYQKHNPFAKAY